MIIIYRRRAGAAIRVPRVERRVDLRAPFGSRMETLWVVVDRPLGKPLERMFRLQILQATPPLQRPRHEMKRFFTASELLCTL